MISEYIDICKAEREKAGLPYNQNKTVWDQLFKCPSPGCIVRTIYFKLFNDHVDANIHCYNSREGLRHPVKPKSKVIEEVEEE
jgi:hypothetical protein